MKKSAVVVTRGTENNHETAETKSTGNAQFRKNEYIKIPIIAC